MPYHSYATMQYDGGIILNEIQKHFIHVEGRKKFFRIYFEIYHDDLIQFNDFLVSEHLDLATFEYKDARNYLSFYIHII